MTHLAPCSLELMKPEKADSANRSGGCLLVCLLFYVRATSKVMSGRVPTCDSTPVMVDIYNAAVQGNEATSTMT